MAKLYPLLLIVAIFSSSQSDDCQLPPPQPPAPPQYPPAPNREFMGNFMLQDQCAPGRYLRTNGAPHLTIGFGDAYDPEVTYEVYDYGSSTPVYVSLKANLPAGGYVTRQGLSAPDDIAITTQYPDSPPFNCDDDRLFVYGSTTPDLIRLKSHALPQRSKAYLIPEDFQPKLSSKDYIYWSLYNYMAPYATRAGRVSLPYPGSAGEFAKCRSSRSVPSGTQLFGTATGSGGLPQSPSGTGLQNRRPPNCPSGQTLYLATNRNNQIELSRESSSRATLSIQQYQLYEGYDRSGRFLTGETIVIGIPNTRRYLTVGVDSQLDIPLNETRSRGGRYYMPQPIMYQSVTTKNHDSMVPMPVPARCNMQHSRQPQSHRKSYPSPKQYPQSHPASRTQPHPRPSPNHPVPRPHPSPKPSPNSAEGDPCLLRYAVDERVFKVVRTGRNVRLQHGFDSTKYLASLRLEDGSHRLVVTSLTSHISRDLLNFEFNIPVQRIPKRSYHRGPNRQARCRRSNQINKQ